MDVLSEPFAELTARLAAGDRLSSAQVNELAGTLDLAALGAFGESARRVLAGHVVTFGRVCDVASGSASPDPGRAGEVRITGRPEQRSQALAWVERAVRAAQGRPVTGFSSVDLLAWVGGDASALTALCRDLRSAGLESVAEIPIDAFGADDEAIACVRAIQAAELGTWRFVVHHGPLDARLPLLARVDAIQTATGGVRAFAPLPVLDPPAAPSTGYDDVRTVALARAVCRDVPVIQIDWRQYGPKLAQVAIAFGANDLDNVPATDDEALGPRRAAGEELARQIRAAGATPQERDGRFQPLPEAMRS